MGRTEKINRKAMKKVKTFGSLFMSMLSCSIIGGYVTSTIKMNQPIELHRWMLTGFFGLFFLINFLFEYKNNK